MVCGCATIVSHAIARKYPPDAAQSDMDAMTGFDWAVSFISRHIASEAWKLPPGELMRTTTAFTPSASRALFISLINDSAPMMLLPFSDFPGRIVPSATTTAISFLEDLQAEKLLLYLEYLMYSSFLSASMPTRFFNSASTWSTYKSESTRPCSSARRALRTNILSAISSSFSLGIFLASATRSST